MSSKDPPSSQIFSFSIWRDEQTTDVWNIYSHQNEIFRWCFFTCFQVEGMELGTTTSIVIHAKTPKKNRQKPSAKHRQAQWHPFSDVWDLQILRVFDAGPDV